MKRVSGGDLDTGGREASGSKHPEVRPRRAGFDGPRGEPVSGATPSPALKAH